MCQLGCWPSAELYFHGTTSSKNLAFHGDKMGGKDHYRVTQCPLVPVTRQNIAIGADSRMIPIGYAKLFYPVSMFSPTSALEEL